VSFSRFHVVHLARFDSPVNRARADVRYGGCLIGRKHLHFPAAVSAPFGACEAAAFQDKQPLPIDFDFDSAFRGWSRLSVESSMPANFNHSLRPSY
jgi:hypothetical protein